MFYALELLFFFFVLKVSVVFKHKPKSELDSFRWLIESKEELFLLTSCLWIAGLSAFIHD